jgi:hypothetical protein
MNEGFKNPADSIDFFSPARRPYHPIGLDILPFTAPQLKFHVTAFSRRRNP